MKRIVYILLMGLIFASIDWSVIYLTRFTHPEWKEWMHAHERQYVAIKLPLELLFSAPSIPLKPIFQQALISVTATPNEKKAITHAPPMSWRGFYRPVVRGQPYVFTSWFSWLVMWSAPAVLWFMVARRFKFLM